MTMDTIIKISDDIELNKQDDGLLYVFCDSEDTGFYLSSDELNSLARQSQVLAAAEARERALTAAARRLLALAEHDARYCFVPGWFDATEDLRALLSGLNLSGVDVAAGEVLAETE